MKIPITMHHGIDPKRKLPLTIDRFKEYFRISAEKGFKSIIYDDLDVWWTGKGKPAAR